MFTGVEMKKILEECIVVAGSIHGDNFLAKSRDRNYVPHVKIYRELTPEGLEVVYLHDTDTDYMEGMNSAGIGIVNAALLVGDDEKAVKGKTKSKDGAVMRKALECDSLQDCIKTLISYGGGIKGHTIVGDSNVIYTIEMTSRHNPIIKKVKRPDEKSVVRTNHGKDHEGAGYTPDRKPDDYISSKVRKATAEVQMSSVDKFEKVAPALTVPMFDPESNYNMSRRTDNMRTRSQCAMNLKKKHFHFYYFPDECEYLGYEDKIPDDKKRNILVKVIKYRKPS